MKATDKVRTNPGAHPWGSGQGWTGLGAFWWKVSLARAGNEVILKSFPTQIIPRFSDLVTISWFPRQGNPHVLRGWVVQRTGISYYFPLGKHSLIPSRVTIALEAVGTCLACSFLQEKVIFHIQHRHLKKIQQGMQREVGAQFNSIFGGIWGEQLQSWSSSQIRAQGTGTDLQARHSLLFFLKTVNFHSSQMQIKLF